MIDNLPQLLAEMTLEEKAGLCSGLNFWETKAIDRLGIPSIMLTDGPHGLRKQRANSAELGLFDSVPATCFPSAVGLAASWNTELLQSVGAALGLECQVESVGVLLGPGANIKRSPLCGRNFEYFSEDPYLSSHLAAAHIQGVQSQGIGASLKHFAVNNQEQRRLTIDAVVDQRTLHEIYLASFEYAVKAAQPWTVMCAYNKVNGEYASEHAYLLNDVLKTAWGHEGLVVSDWGAVNERVTGLAHGLELEMPGSGGVTDKLIVAAVNNGGLALGALDAAVLRILKLTQKVLQNRQPDAVFDAPAHHALARKVATECMVLLKNESQLLPLAKSAKLAVIGELATSMRYQGGGSSRVVPTQLDETLTEIGAKLQGGKVDYARGYDLASDQADAALVAQALAAAQSAEVAILFIGLPDRYESEGYDRTHLRIPDNQRQLIDAIAAVQPKLVVVLNNGSPIEMPWAAHAGAILEAYLGGQAQGGAIADLLFGDRNPSGKLAETFPLRLEDTPAFLNFPGEQDTVEYREGMCIGYRYYEAVKRPILFPFGHGLSYTKFEYGSLNLSATNIHENDSLNVNLTIANTGTQHGQEVVQLYVADLVHSLSRPQKELKAFAKVSLAPGESKTVSFALDRRAFAFYHPTLADWVVESGKFDIVVGASSQDIRQQASVEVQSDWQAISHYHRNTAVGTLLARPETAALLHNWLAEVPPEANFLTIMQSMGSDMLEAMAQEFPLRALVLFSRGHIDFARLDALLEQLRKV
ncbi:MAG: glycoside hydrolase family 3 C-terminal domain-containing protein [Pseudomonadota bacterium]